MTCFVVGSIASMGEMGVGKMVSSLVSKSSAGEWVDVGVACEGDDYSSAEGYAHSGFDDVDGYAARCCAEVVGCGCASPDGYTVSAVESVV